MDEVHVNQRPRRQAHVPGLALPEYALDDHLDSVARRDNASVKLRFEIFREVPPNHPQNTALARARSAPSATDGGGQLRSMIAGESKVLSLKLAAHERANTHPFPLVLGPMLKYLAEIHGPRCAV
jgi:hypothetical protein